MVLLCHIKEVYLVIIKRLNKLKMCCLVCGKVVIEDDLRQRITCVFLFRDLDDGRDNDQQPFSGYKHPRPEIIRTITNPYARTLEVRHPGPSHHRKETQLIIYTVDTGL